jgi:aspartyl-tRNA(Asn)/glutamyl-tRNA(Gln) amidotransferase subunit A
MFQHTLAQLTQLLQNKEVTSEELTRLYLQRSESFNEVFNCYISITHDLAIKQAKAADARLQSGKAETLTGIPIVHKDMFCSKGVKTSCASKMLDNFIAPYDATVVERLQDAGMVTLGIAARLTPAATGTDTGGSIRQPAALCGITGLKPTYGRVSRYGMIAFASSLDQGGTLTQTAEDSAMLLSAMAGFDTRDSTSVDRPVDDYLGDLDKSIEGLTIGLPKQYFDQNLDSEIGKVIDAAVEVLQKSGAKVKDIELPNTHLSIPAYYVVAPAECSSNLERYDGVRYGYRCEDPENLADLYCRSRAEGFGKEVKRRILIGTYVLSSGYYDAYYLKAQKIRRLIRDDFNQAFKDVDVILGPTTPSTAFKLNEHMQDPISMYLSDIYTVSVNLAGLPGISIPAGFSAGLPVGMQLIGNYFEEAKLLNVAHRFQQETDWHQQQAQGLEK